MGAGQFGNVYSALWCFSHHKLKVAVKILRPNASEEDKVKFLQEAAIMGQFKHPNVVEMHGVITQGEPVSNMSMH